MLDVSDDPNQPDLRTIRYGGGGRKISLAALQHETVAWKQRDQST